MIPLNSAIVTMIVKTAASKITKRLPSWMALFFIIPRFPLVVLVHGQVRRSASFIILSRYHLKRPQNIFLLFFPYRVFPLFIRICPIQGVSRTGTGSSNTTSSGVTRESKANTRTPAAAAAAKASPKA